MSTFYATFQDLRDARLMLDELLRDGVRPEDLSLVASLRAERSDAPSFMAEYAKSVGDATSFVGGSDDPVRAIPPQISRFGNDTTLEEGEISRIDTSKIATDVDSIDQSDDSQELADEMTYPLDDVSQGDHQSDDMKLSILTGFPTAMTVEDTVRDGEISQDQFDEALESIVVPGFGLVVGGGALATAALDAVDPSGAAATDSLVAHLREEGLPAERAGTYLAAYDRGDALLAVAINPGSVDENKVERLADRYHAVEAELFDAPRY